MALKKTGKDCEKLGILIANMGIDYKFNIQFDKEFIDKTQVIVRVYIINAASLPQMDDDSLSDPYIEVKLGNETKNVVFQ